MQGINAQKVSLPYTDPGIFLGDGVVQAFLPENNPDNFFSPQL